MYAANGTASPVDVAAMFYTALNDPKPLTSDFSKDGLHFISTHADDSIRVASVGALAPTDAVPCTAFGAHLARFTHSSAVVTVAPRLPRDGHLHLLHLETACVIASLAHVTDAAPSPALTHSSPFFASLAQCPTSDVIGAVSALRAPRVMLFHPLVSGAIAVSSGRGITGSRTCLGFGGDGHTVLLGDDRCVRLYDRRKLFDEAVTEVANSAIFSQSPSGCRCKGVDFSADSSLALLTSACGEAVLFDLHARAVVRRYFHGDVKRHFTGTGDAPAARFLSPGAPVAETKVVQPGAVMLGGRHLLVYSEHADAGGNARLEMELQAKDSDVPSDMSVNPRYSLVSTAARSVTWWAFHFDSATK